MRKHEWYQRGVAALLSVLMVCATSGVSFGETAAALPYSGQTIFRGIFLGDGPVAKLFPEIWESPTISAYTQRSEQEKSAQEIAAEKQQILNLLQAQDSTFFNRFGVEMRSGDRIRIQQALTEAGTRLKQELNKQVASPDVRPPLLVVYLYIAIAVVVEVAVAIAEIIPEVGIASSSSLKGDTYVDLIAQRLATK